MAPQASANSSSAAFGTVPLTGIPGSSLTWTDIDTIIRNIDNNPLIAYESLSEAKKAEIAEKLLTAVDISLIIGGGEANGKFLPGVGVSATRGGVGTIDGFIGSLFGMAKGVFVGGNGDLFPQLSGQNDLKMQRAKQVKANLDIQAKRDKLNVQIEAIKRALIIAEAERNFAFGQDQLKPIGQLDATAKNMESGGWLDPLKQSGVSLAANGIQTDPENFKRQIADASVELEGLQGISIDSKQVLGVQMPRGLVTIDPGVKARLWAAVQANNLDFQYAQGLIDSNGLTVSIEDLNGPGFNFAPEFLTQPSVNPAINPSSIRTTSAVTSTQGFAPTALIRIPIHNESHDINVALVKEDQQKVGYFQKETQVAAKVRFEQAVNDINSLATTISERIAAFNEFKARVDNADHNHSYPPDQLIDNHKTLISLNAEINGLLTKYYGAWADLRSLGATGMNGPLIPSGIGSSVALSAIANSPVEAASFETTIIEPGPAVDPEIARFDDIKSIPIDVLRPGQMEYPNGPEGFKMFIEALAASGHTSPLEVLKGILTDDSNIFTRRMALDLLFSDYKGQDEFYTAINDIIDKSPYADVIWGLDKYLSEGEKFDIRDNIRKIQGYGVGDKNNKIAAGLTLQALGDIITSNPDALKTLSLNDFESNPDKVLITFLLREPDASIAKERLLQYLELNDLARLHSKLEVYIGKHHGEADFKKFEAP